MAADIITKEQIKDYNKIPNKRPTVAKRRSGYLLRRRGYATIKKRGIMAEANLIILNVGASLLICFRKLVYAINRVE